jgi:zinc transport system substrate-binding protein
MVCGVKVSHALLALPLLAAACGSGDAAGSDETSVVAAVYPLEFVAHAIAGDAATVEDLTPAGQEPHDIELTSGQIVEVSDADLLIYIGEDFQPALEDVIPDVEGETLDALDEVDVLESGDQVDPHMWLDPLRLIEVAGAAADHLSEIDAAHAKTYMRNYRSLAGDLLALDRYFEKTLELCERNEIVTSHDAFGYLADRYGLEQIGIAGIDPESEPSPQRLAEVADFVREHDVKTIFFEELLPPAVADTIAEETGATTRPLNPLESPPEEGDYISAMRANLRSLQEGLGCE